LGIVQSGIDRYLAGRLIDDKRHLGTVGENEGADESNPTPE
jgi:hypothetical protein